jgi:hypothetical protein
MTFGRAVHTALPIDNNKTILTVRGNHCEYVRAEQIKIHDPRQKFPARRGQKLEPYVDHDSPRPGESGLKLCTATRNCVGTSTPQRNAIVMLISHSPKEASWPSLTGQALPLRRSRTRTLPRSRLTRHGHRRSSVNELRCIRRTAGNVAHVA